MKKHLSIGLSAFALAALLSGCAGTSGTGTSTPPAATTAAPGSAPATSAPASTSAPAASTPAVSAPDLKVSESTAGTIVVDGKWMSVYYYTKDVKDSGTSACTGGCLAAWPPVLTAADTPAVDGVTGAVGTINTPDGKKTADRQRDARVSLCQGPGTRGRPGPGRRQCLVPHGPTGEMITAAAGY